MGRTGALWVTTNQREKQRHENRNYRDTPPTYPATLNFQLRRSSSTSQERNTAFTVDDHRRARTGTFVSSFCTAASGIDSNHASRRENLRVLRWRQRAVASCQDPRRRRSARGPCSGLDDDGVVHATWQSARLARLAAHVRHAASPRSHHRRVRRHRTVLCRATRRDWPSSSSLPAGAIAWRRSRSASAPRTNPRSKCCRRLASERASTRLPRAPPPRRSTW